MTPSERVQSHTHSPTRRQHERRSSPPTANTESSYQHKCIDPEARRQLVANQHHDQTEFVYHLWHAVVTNACPDGVKCLARTYLSPELARHDAVCWLINIQNLAGASTESYWTYIAYEEEHEKCYYYCTDDLMHEELGISCYAWTTAGRLL